MGTVKDRNVMDLTEAEDIKEGWPEYTEELYNNEINLPYLLLFCLFLSYI